jgi:hypothetical protein
MQRLPRSQGNCKFYYKTKKTSGGHRKSNSESVLAIAAEDSEVLTDSLLDFRGNLHRFLSKICSRQKGSSQ